MKHRQAKKITKKYTTANIVREVYQMGAFLGWLEIMGKPRVSQERFDRAVDIVVKRKMSGRKWTRIKRAMDIKIANRCPELAAVLNINLETE